MVVYLMTGVLIFASVIHYAEQENFPSILIGERFQLFSDYSAHKCSVIIHAFKAPAENYYVCRVNN